MVLSHRQMLTIISLLFYWPAIFILTHIPISQIVLKNIQLSDKVLHYLGYLILVFLLWLAISPDRKVNWKRAAVWWVLFVVVWYGAFDEWLQSYVGRDPDVTDFLANLAGTLTGLILLSILSFWPASLVVAGVAIFILINFSKTNLANPMPAVNATFHLFAYGIFTMLWIQCMYQASHPPLRGKARANLSPRRRGWLIEASALPIGLLLAVEVFSAALGNAFRIQEVIISVMAIVAVIATIATLRILRCSSS